MSHFIGKRLLITGCCGSIGSEMIRQLVHNDQYSPQCITGLDNNESELFFNEESYRNQPNVNFFLTDIRDRDTLSKHMEGIDIVFHTAALKHVVMCERSPMDAIQTNIHGVQNVIQAAIEADVERVIFTSSDKAVNPTNVMGTSKLMGERLITAANSLKRGKGPIFSSTRFGNVLGSRGSVIPIFKNQIAAGGPVTLTHANMTRFIMSIEQSVQLVIQSSLLACGGEVFITKMPVVNISDVASVMIEELAPLHGYDPADIATDIIGTKPGEKIYEELMSDEETRRAEDLGDFFAVIPAFVGLYQQIDYSYGVDQSAPVQKPYNSSNEPALTKVQISKFLRDNRLLFDETKKNQQDQRYWPGDKESSSI